MHLFNTDFSGFMDFLDLIDHNFNNKEVLILGSGGSSKAIAYSLKLLNIKYHIVSRSLRDNTISYNDVPNLYTNYNVVITSASYSNGCNAGYTSLASDLDYLL